MIPIFIVYSRKTVRLLRPQHIKQKLEWGIVRKEIQ